MIILYLNDGLGNQMFQFALYRKLQSLGKEIYLYDEDLRRKDALHNGLELERVFGLVYPRITARQFRPYDTRHLFNHIIRKLFYEKKYPTYEEGALSYKPEVLELDNVCLRGYWQSEQYFKSVEEIVKKDFCFPPLSDEKNQAILKMIKGSSSVGIHVRRGDYLNSKYKNVFGNVCTEAYYRNAIQYIKGQIPDAEFFIFSNDVGWCRQVFDAQNTTFIEGNIGTESYKDMQLMSQCKHQIIANSTFSWWAAWLNPNAGKIVVAPPIWMNDAAANDIICKDWVKMPL